MHNVKMEEKNIKHIVCTTGEPASIGPQITVRAIAEILAEKRSDAIFHILIEPQSAEKILRFFNLQSLQNHPQIVWHFQASNQAVVFGELNPENGLYGLELLHRAMQIMQEKAILIDKDEIKNKINLSSSLGAFEDLDVDKIISNMALVTAPLHKNNIDQALQNYKNNKNHQNFNIKNNLNIEKNLPKRFYGHTEYLAELAKDYGFSEKILPVLMLLKGFDAARQKQIMLALATVHCPLLQIKERLLQKIQNGRMRYDFLLMIDGLQRLFNNNSENIKKIYEIKVSGLNPHAGEAGLLGDEEIKHIQPFLQTLMNDANIKNQANISGCFSGDTLMLQDADCFYYMQHDQGLAPFKYATFGQAANITLGLPFIRSSVDHGTALDIARLEQHQAVDYQSMKYAIMEAIYMLESQLESQL